MFQHRRALAAAFAILFGPLALPFALWRILPFGDLGDFHVPMCFLYRQALRSGQTMLWSPALGSGIYLHAEGQSGMAHPFHLLIYRFLPLTAAISLEMLASYVVALAGMFLFLRHLSFRRDAAATGALLFAFSGFQLLHLNHLNLVAVTAHIPWLLYAADVVLTAPDRRRLAVAFAGVGLILGFELLLGFPLGCLAQRRCAGMADHVAAGGWCERFPSGAGVRRGGRRRSDWRYAAAADSRRRANIRARGNDTGVPRHIFAAPAQSRATVLALRLERADLCPGE